MKTQQIDTVKLLTPHRLPDETFEQYKTRRQFANKSTQRYLKGSFFYANDDHKDNKGKFIPYRKNETN